MGGDIRVGFISSINEKTGMVRVTYPDRNKSVTAEIPYFNHTGEYMMPRINDMVIVAHVSNDSSMGIVLGSYWNLQDLPPETGLNTFHKKLSPDGTCFMKQQDGDVSITDRNGYFSVQKILELESRIKRLEAAGE